MAITLADIAIALRISADGAAASLRRNRMS